MKTITLKQYTLVAIKVASFLGNIPHAENPEMQNEALLKHLQEQLGDHWCVRLHAHLYVMARKAHWFYNQPSAKYTSMFQLVTFDSEIFWEAFADTAPELDGKMMVVHSQGQKIESMPWD